MAAIEPGPGAIIRARGRGQDVRPAGGASVASTGVLLFLSSCATAVIHALIPDHWLPFVLMSRSRRWSEGRTVGTVALAGLVHVLVSFGVAAIAIGFASTPARLLAESLGATLEMLAGMLLILFGLVYGILAHRREARAHPHGGESPGKAERPHAHGHLLERWFHGGVSAGALVAIIGVSPCVLLQPILFGAAARGHGVLAATAVGFAVCTIGTMIGVTMVAIRGMRRFELPLFARYGDLISGLLIAGLGLFVVLQEI